MPTYLILFNSPSEVRKAAMSASTEEVKESMQNWIDWKEAAEKEGGITFEWGLPLKPAERISAGGISSSESEVSGHAMIEGEHDRVVALLKDHPHLRSAGTTIDLLEMIPLENM